MAKSYVKEPLKGQVGKATGLGHLTTSSMYGTCSGNGISRALPLLPRRERERRQLLGQAATCTTPALPRPSGLALAGASDSWEPPPMLALLGPGAGGGQSQATHHSRVGALAACLLEDRDQGLGVEPRALLFFTFFAILRGHLFKIPKLVVTAHAC